MALERVDKLFASESWSVVYTAFTNVSLKAYDFDNIKEALLTYVSETYPDKFNDMIASSEFIAIVDLVAYFGHALSFRLDMNTRENFLDTAERRESILRMARTLGYNKTRPVNARGYVKVTSVKTTQDIYDSNGNVLSNRVIRWNDPNNVSWYDNFVSILNAALDGETKIDSPAGTVETQGVINSLFYLNEDDAAKSVKYGFTSNIAGKNRNFEVVRATIDNDDIVEAMPDPVRRMTIISRTDNLGPSSDRTGFFFYVKAGQLKYRDFNYTSKISNRAELIDDINISNSDIWIQRINDTGTVLGEVAKVDNDTRETAIYNILRGGDGHIVSVHTEENNQVRLQYPDGIFGNAAYGRYRTWYRIVENEAFSVNENDIKEGTINITYKGTDNRSYVLTLTLESTRDFAENFEGENYTSVRRIAPRAYYTQDRMVNGQDYNILPYSLGTNIVTKLKSVNTTFAGNSRYFEADDTTGHHSTVHVTGIDGSVFVDRHSSRMSFNFQRGVNDARDFVTNRLVQVLKHPTMITKYFYLVRNSQVDGGFSRYDYELSGSGAQWVPNNLDPIRGIILNDNTGTSFGEGDYIQMNNGQWYFVRNVDTNNQLVLDRIVNRESLTQPILIERIIKGPTTRFSYDEVTEILPYFDDQSSDSFYVYYWDSTWIAQTEEEMLANTEGPTSGTDLDTGDYLYFRVDYNPGIRENTSFVEVTFYGKKLVFESDSQVKFFYSNNEIVIDNETNLASRDTIALTYKNENSEIGATEVKEDTYDVVIGFAPVENGGIDPLDPLKTLIIGDFAEADAIKNATFFNIIGRNGPKNIEPVSYKYQLVTPFNVTFNVSPVEDYDTKIGDTGVYTVTFSEIFDEISSQLTPIALPEGQAGGNRYLITDSPYDDASADRGMIVSLDTFEPRNETSCATPSFYTITTTVAELRAAGFSGVGYDGPITKEYFDAAIANEKFFWMDETAVTGVDNNTTTGKSLDTALPGDLGVQTQFTVEVDPSDSSTFIFTLPKLSTFAITPGDVGQGTVGISDIYFKQLSYGMVRFYFDVNDPQWGGVPGPTNDNIFFRKTDTKEIIDRDVFTIDPARNWNESTGEWEDVPNTWDAVFWTESPGVPGTDTLDIYFGSIAESLDGYHAKLIATVKVTESTKVVTDTYEELSTYVTGEYVNSNGDVDNRRVLVSPMTVDNNPIGLFDIMWESDSLDQFRIRHIYDDQQGTEVSEVYLAGEAGYGHPDSNDLQPETNLYYDIADEVWYEYDCSGQPVLPTPDPQYFIYADRTSYDEGDVIYGVVSTIGVPDGTVLYVGIEQVTGDITTSDFESLMTASVLIENGTGQYTFVLAEDYFTDSDIGTDVFKIVLGTGINTAVDPAVVLDVKKETFDITINDTSLTLNPTYAMEISNPFDTQYNVYRVDETANVSGYINTTEVVAGTPLYVEVIPLTFNPDNPTESWQPVDASDFDGGVLQYEFASVENANTAPGFYTYDQTPFTFRLSDDLTIDEGYEYFTLNLKVDPIPAGTVVATSDAAFAVRDTSIDLTPSYEIVIDNTNNEVEEGQAVLGILNTKNVAPGTILYIEFEGLTSGFNSADLMNTVPSGRVGTNGEMTSIIEYYTVGDQNPLEFFLSLDGTTEVGETFKINVLTSKTSLSPVAVTQTLTVVDTSVDGDASYAWSFSGLTTVGDSDHSINEGATFDITFNLTGVANGTVLQLYFDTYSGSSGLITPDDFDPSTFAYGTLKPYTVGTDPNPLSITVNADLFPDGPPNGWESLMIRAIDPQGNIVLVSPIIRIQDTSRSLVNPTMAPMMVSRSSHECVWKTATYVEMSGSQLIKMTAGDYINDKFILEYQSQSYSTKPRHIILRNYIENGIGKEKVYEFGFADYGHPTNIKMNEETLLYYDAEDGNPENGEWYLLSGGLWIVPAYTRVYPESSRMIEFGNNIYRIVEGISYTEGTLPSFRWDHYADKEKRIDIDTSNIIDMYVLTTDYVNRVNEWIANKFEGDVPRAPNSFELRKVMESIESKAAIADHISYIPVKFKYLFGDYAEVENQAYFDVIKRQGSPYTNSETKTAVATKINEYFALSNWDFGDTFYFSEMAAYLHQELGDYISSVKIVPKLDSSTLGDVLSITCERDEIFLAVTSSKDINIVDVLSK